MRQVLIVDPHITGNYEGKLGGYFERFKNRVVVLVSEPSRNFDLEKEWANKVGIDLNQVLSLPQFINKNERDYILFLECRVYLNDSLKNFLAMDNPRSIISTNHFFRANLDTLSFIKKNIRKVTYLAESNESIPNVIDAWQLSKESHFEVIPPVLDTSKNAERFSLMFGRRSVNSLPPGILHAGVIMYHRPRPDRYLDNWWQSKFDTLDYFPWRSLIHKNADYLDLESISVIVEDNSRRNNFFNQLKRRLEILTGKQKANYAKYYQLDIEPYFLKHDFFICPQDIFSVFPQFGFHAMRAGLIIVGDDSAVFKTLGFVNGINYISIGEQWDLEAIRETLLRIKKLDAQSIKLLRNASLELRYKIEANATQTYLKVFD